MLIPPEPIESGPWMLDPKITYLNHGSFGARTHHVHKTQEQFKLEFESSPIQFLDRSRDELIGGAREVVAEFLGCDPSGFGFVDNATTGIGCVVHSIQFDVSDEILTTNHVYNGVRQLLSHHASREGCTYRELEIKMPVHGASEILETIINAFTPSTKLFIVDHVASMSSLVFPVTEIVEECHKRGILVLIDGAHAPGMLDLHIDSIQADWYVGNLHKWVCAPLGAGFVWTSEMQRERTHPLTVSHFLGISYTDEFGWQGTRDISPWLSAATAVRLGEEIGWERIRTHNHEMVMWMHQELKTALDVEPLTPLDGSLSGSMATVQLPSGFPKTVEECDALSAEIYVNHNIEVPIFFFDDMSLMRVSAQLYTKSGDVHQLIEVLRVVRSKSDVF